MHYSELQLLWLLIASVIAGAMNAVAGGGTLITFPALVAAGVPMIVANATSTVALVPGSLAGAYTFRRDTRTSGSTFLWMMFPSIIGGALGAILAVHVGNKTFGEVVPWLILSATILFMVNEPIARYIRSKTGDNLGAALESTPSRSQLIRLCLIQFPIALYGGFFGAGIGIMMLASLGILGLTNIHRMNGLKNGAAASINLIAAAMFIALHRVDWVLALTMTVGAVAGSFSGATIARRIGQANVRKVIIAIGLVIAALLFKQSLHQ